MAGTAEARNELLHSTFDSSRDPYNSRFVGKTEVIRQIGPDKSSYRIVALRLPSNASVVLGFCSRGIAAVGLRLSP
jgi:hypothetical protein